MHDVASGDSLQPNPSLPFPKLPSLHCKLELFYLIPTMTSSNAANSTVKTFEAEHTCVADLKKALLSTGARSITKGICLAGPDEEELPGGPKGGAEPHML